MLPFILLSSMSVNPKSRNDDPRGTPKLNSTCNLKASSFGDALDKFG